MAIPAQKPPAPAAVGPQTRRLKKGELLFAEGENSRAMYLIRSGMIRLYKKKGDSNIELDTIRSGAVLGELAFLDGNPRSASGEALTDCELTEISGPAFQNVLSQMPEWLKIMLKAVVGRLRTASTRIRQLESASTAFDYSDKDGKRTSHYVYMGPHDVLKIATGILLVAARNGKPSPDGFDVNNNLVQRYVHQVMGVPVAKISTFMDVLGTTGIMVIKEVPGADPQIFLKDADFLERFIAYLGEENLLEPSKRHDLSIRGFIVMSCIAKHAAKYPKNPEGISSVNLAAVKAAETNAEGKSSFRMEEFPELVKLGYCSQLNAKSATEAFTDIRPEHFMLTYRFQKVLLAINAVNEQKRKAGGTGK